jgi:DNA end-binding protein Ku
VASLLPSFHPPQLVTFTAERPMAAIWKGAISFGLVSIPVELRTAVRSDRLSFRMLHAEDLSPVKYERICAVDGEPVPWDEVVKGYEYAKGKFVVLTDEDFERAALEASRTIDILDFVKQEEIDPRYFETPYYLIPAKGGERPYALLRDAMRRTGSIGIGKIIIRQKQHLAAVKVVGDALVLELMRFANELVETDEFSFPSSDVVKPQELTMAEQLITNLAEPFAPDKYTDDYRANLMRIIKAKLKGKKVDLEAEEKGEPEDAQVLDLMSRLRESLEQGKKATTKRSKSGAVRSRRKTAASRERSSDKTSRSA